MTHFDEMIFGIFILLNIAVLPGCMFGRQTLLSVVISAFYKLSLPAKICWSVIPIFLYTIFCSFGIILINKLYSIYNGLGLFEIELVVLAIVLGILVLIDLFWLSMFVFLTIVDD